MLISVITPTNNRLKYLIECMESVQSSIFAPLDIQVEHIIFDVSENNETYEYFQNEKLSKNIKYFKHPESLIPSKARNLAIKEAKGEYIFPLDDDDVLLQRTIHNFVKLVNKDTKWICSDFLRVDENLSYIKGNDYYGWNFENPSQMLNSIFEGMHFMQGNVMYQRSLFDEVGGYDENMIYAEDLDLYVRFILSVGLPLYMPFISHLHRVHTNNISKDIDHRKHFDDLAMIYNKYLIQLKNLNIKPKQ